MCLAKILSLVLRKLSSMIQNLKPWCVSLGLWRNRETIGKREKERDHGGWIHTYILTIRSKVIQLWRLRGLELLSTSWILRRAYDVILVQVQKPENYESWFSLSLKSKSRRLISQLKDTQPEREREREKFLSYLAFSSTQAFSRLDETHPHWGGQSAVDSDVHLIQKHPHQHTQK